MRNKTIIALIIVACGALVGSFYAGHGIGKSAGERIGYDKAAREIRCDGGGHIPNPWRKEKK